MSQLDTFEGRSVVGCRMTIAKAGDGLSAPLEAAPVTFHSGDTVHVVLECEVTDVGFRPTKDDPESLLRVHRLATVAAAILPPDVAEPLLANAAREIADAAEAARKAAEEAAGVTRLFDGAPDDDLSADDFEPSVGDDWDDDEETE